MDNKAPHTAQPNVWILDEAFNIPQLRRTRRIWIYLPLNYHDSDKSYPVIYMHDGQNLFDQATAYWKEWEVDETLNSLAAQCIVVGIDNSEYRMREYNFNDNIRYGAGEGRQYISFIVHTLKPYIDARFRTMPQREYTHIAGSSMGGLVSLYGALHFAQVFGGAGVFSPSLWASPYAVQQLQPIVINNTQYPQRFYFYGGAREGAHMAVHTNKIANLLSQYPHYQVQVVIKEDGEHNEEHWRGQFPDYYKWLMNEADRKSLV